jgi:hypothetical protein
MPSLHFEFTPIGIWLSSTFFIKLILQIYSNKWPTRLTQPIAKQLGKYRYTFKEHPLQSTWTKKIQRHQRQNNTTGLLHKQELPKHHGKTELPIGKFSYLKEEERLEQLPPIGLSLFISFNLLTIGSYQSLWSIYTTQSQSN